jgi:hypothetical protein
MKNSLPIVRVLKYRSARTLVPEGRSTGYQLDGVPARRYSPDVVPGGYRLRKLCTENRVTIFYCLNPY